MHEVGTASSVEAWHVMPGMAGPEGKRHSHDYRIEVVVQRPELDERGMVCDLDVLEAALGEATARVDGGDLDVIIAEDGAPVTVEIFARWVHATLSDAVRQGGGEVLAVRVFESPYAFGGYRAPVS
jgi:6-pyruvoyltetrahydropterin/6-carboxytetrahydropterin synthase